MFKLVFRVGSDFWIMEWIYILSVVVVVLLGAVAYLGGKVSSEAKLRSALGKQLEEAQAKAEALIAENREFEKQVVELKTRIEKDVEAYEAKLDAFRQAEQKLTDAFKALSSDALKSSNEQFLKLANATFEKLKEGAKGELDVKQEAINNMVKPINEGLKQFNERISDIEKRRVAQLSGISELVQSLMKAHEETRLETHNLASALKAPSVRGQWGEIHLRRTIEISGMINYVDFIEQKNIAGDENKLIPDLVINLPNKRKVIVDAKAPLGNYLEAQNTTDINEQKRLLDLHARQIREHLKKLGQKAYHVQLEESPEFVVLFLPGEVFYSAALQQDPELIEYGVDKKVLIATPTTLIALLKSIAYGWRNQEIAEKADEISKSGRELYDSVVIMLEHFAGMRRNLNAVVGQFNKTVRSTEKRLLPKARRFKSLNAGSERDLPELNLIDETLDVIEEDGRE